MEGLTRKILVAMAVGVATGIALNVLFSPSGVVFSYLVDGVLYTLGAIFIAALKMLVVPIVFVSLVCGVSSLGDLASLGRMSVKAVSLYLLTTTIAISIALSLAISVGPGSNFENTDRTEFAGQEPPPLAEVFINMVPSNPVAAMAEGNMLQLIVFAVVFGIALTMSGDRSREIRSIFQSLDVVVLKMVELVMRFAPYGVFALITRTFSTQGVDMILPLIGYFITLTSALVLHVTVVYSSVLKILANLSPVLFFRKMRDPFSFAFSTASSGATIPVTLRTVQEQLGVDKSVGSFTVPLGATINMDGTAIMQGVATVFIANVYGVDLTVIDYLTVVVTATLASIGTAAVPGVGLVMLTIVLNQVGLPVEGIALIIGVDRLLDMLRTGCNVTGDCAVTCVIAEGENALNRETFNNVPGERDVERSRLSQG